MTVLPLTATPARARVVAAALCIARGIDVHDLAGSAILGEQRGHPLHRLVNVAEEGLIAGTQIVEPGLAFRRGDEAILGTATVAREADVAPDRQ